MNTEVLCLVGNKNSFDRLICPTNYKVLKDVLSCHGINNFPEFRVVKCELK